MPQTLQYGLIAPDDPALAGLIARHAAESARHYPADSNHHLDGPALAAQGAILFAARLGGPDGPVRAMGGYAPLSATEAEIKSMHVETALRGQGAGARILTLILDHAKASGFARLWLETGSLPASAPARRLYARAGFTPCPPFGTYRPDPMSVFMTRTL
jgi:putative acetyltransferase